MNKIKKNVSKPIMILLVIISVIVFSIFVIRRPRYSLSFEPVIEDIMQKKAQDTSELFDAISFSKQSIVVSKENSQDAYVSLLPFISVRETNVDTEVSELDFSLNFYIQVENLSDKQVWKALQDFYFCDTKWQINLEDGAYFNIQDTQMLTIPYAVNKQNIRKPKFFVPMAETKKYRDIKNFIDKESQEKTFKEVLEKNVLFIEDNAIQICYPDKIYPYIRMDSIYGKGIITVFETKIHYTKQSGNSNYPMIAYGQTTINLKSNDDKNIILFDPLSK